MNTEQFPMSGRFLQGRLRHAMSTREKLVVEGLIAETRVLSREEFLVRRGDVCDFSSLLIEGYMMRTIHEGGRRGIVSFQVPGDFVDLHSFALKRLDHDVMAIGQVTMGIVPHERLRRVMDDEPHLARLLWFSTLLDAAIHREWIMKTQTLRAAARIAHVFAELWYRLRMVELGDSDGFRTPFTQIHLAQICGISLVHVSRTLHDLREGGVVEFRRGRVTILDSEKLKAIGQFDPVYLYGEGMLAVRAELGGNACSEGGN